jgi:hypothetical protein
MDCTCLLWPLLMVATTSNPSYHNLCNHIDLHHADMCVQIVVSLCRCKGLGDCVKRSKQSVSSCSLLDNLTILTRPVPLGSFLSLIFYAISVAKDRIWLGLQAKKISRIVDELCNCRKCKSLFSDCRSSWASLSMSGFEGKILHCVSSSGKIMLSFPDFSCKESSEQFCVLNRVNPSVTSPCICSCAQKASHSALLEDANGSKREVHCWILGSWNPWHKRKTVQAFCIR